MKLGEGPTISASPAATRKPASPTAISCHVRSRHHPPRSRPAATSPSTPWASTRHRRNPGLLRWPRDLRQQRPPRHQRRLPRRPVARPARHAVRLPLQSDRRRRNRRRMSRSIAGEYSTLARERIAEEFMKWADQKSPPRPHQRIPQATGWIIHFPEIAEPLRRPARPRMAPRRRRRRFTPCSS